MHGMSGSLQPGLPDGSENCRALDDPLLAGSLLFGLFRDAYQPGDSLREFQGRVSRMTTSCAGGGKH